MKVAPRNTCTMCACADATARYSTWHYCSNPKDSKEFQIVRTIEETSSKQRLVDIKLLPVWCQLRRKGDSK